MFRGLLSRMNVKLIIHLICVDIYPSVFCHHDMVFCDFIVFLYVIW